ncbi:MAG: DUF4919 domain-containing protein [Muribaculaceae bacterium]|nr:DUF4919 domain-containing protein [Muribaculaceae bacterium]
MKSLPVIFAFIIAALTANAQGILPQLKREKPDMDKIKQEVNNPRSPYFYPRLMDEYQKNDTAMKIDKYRHLYLGYVFQEDYNPYRSAENKKTTDLIFRDGKLSRGDLDQVIGDAQAALENDPFDLRQMMLLINAYREKGKTNIAAIWQYKLNYILMAIVSTGTGLDEDNAWFVIEPQHEYVLLNMMNYIVDDQVFYDPYFEFIKVKDPAGKQVGGFYFNIKNLLEEYYRKHPDEI